MLPRLRGDVGRLLSAARCAQHLLIRATCFVIQQNMLSWPFVRNLHPRVLQTASPKLSCTKHIEHLRKGVARGRGYCPLPALWAAPSRVGPFTCWPARRRRGLFLPPSVPTPVYSGLCRYCTLCCLLFLLLLLLRMGEAPLFMLHLFIL